MKLAPNPVMVFVLNTLVRTVVVFFCAWLGWITLMGMPVGPTILLTKEVLGAAFAVALSFTLIAHMFELDDGKEDIIVMLFLGAAILWGVASFLPQYITAGETWMSILSGGLIGLAQIPFARSDD